MPLALPYPVYVIASRDGVKVAMTEGKECILLFHTKDLADQHVEKIKSSQPLLGALHSLAVPNAEALADGLESLPANVTCVVWDPTGTPAGFSHVAVDELLRMARLSR